MGIGHPAKNTLTKADQQRVKLNYLFPFSVFEFTDTLLSIIHNITLYIFCETVNSQQKRKEQGAMSKGKIAVSKRNCRRDAYQADRALTLLFAICS